MTSTTIAIAKTLVLTDLGQAREQAQTRTNNALIAVLAAKVEQDKFAKPAERHYKMGNYLYGTQGSSWGIQNNAATMQQCNKAWLFSPVKSLGSKLVVTDMTQHKRYIFRSSSHVVCTDAGRALCTRHSISVRY